MKSRHFGRSPNPNRVGTARFASMNGYIGVGEYNVLGFRYLKTNNYLSLTLLRRFGISKTYTCLLLPGPSSIARSQSCESGNKRCTKSLL